MFNRCGRPIRFLIRLAALVLFVVSLGVFAGILYQYQWYFPANFQAAQFLAGRESFFVGSYRVAFYAHIVCGPLAILIASFLFWSGRRNYRIGLHRWLGRVQFVLVLVLSLSGLVMAPRAHTGTLAGIGFAILSLLTFLTMIWSLKHVRRGEIRHHQLWSTRLFILLLSTILLRMISGSAALTGIDSGILYPLSAWGSWLVPLMIFELARQRDWEKSESSKKQPADFIAKQNSQP